jgi:hypothetical protein
MLRSFLSILFSTYWLLRAKKETKKEARKYDINVSMSPIRNEKGKQININLNQHNTMMIPSFPFLLSDQQFIFFPLFYWLGFKKEKK